ncbi:GIY-YIG nuclease family protein [candidate division KSB1 bacterium]
MSYYIYILASRKNGTLYIGVSNDLIKRVFEHKQKMVEGFSKRYNISNLVYFEESSDVHSALAREKQLKKWNRAWKIRLIEQQNPEWHDLYEELSG